MARLILLGTKGGPAIRPRGPSPTANLLEVAGHVYVIDCGLGVTRGFVDAGCPLTRLSTILLTHHHSDHNLEIGNLFHTAWTAGLATPVHAYGPPGLAAMMTAFFEMNRFDIETRIDDEGRPDLRRLFHATEYGDGLVLDDGRVRVTALRNNHPPVHDSFALRFEITEEGRPKRTLVMSGDTTFIPSMIEFARGADVLVHEAMYGPGIDTLVARVKNGARLKEHLVASHSLVEEAARIAGAAGVGRLVLNHLIPADDPAVTEQHWIDAARTVFQGALTVGRDGLVIEV